MRESYSDLVTTDQWLDLNRNIPESNLSAVSEQTSAESERQKNPNGVKYHIYGSEYHLKAQCPEAKPPSSVNGKGRKDDTSSGTGTGQGDATKSSNGGAIQRYVHPANEDASLSYVGKTYYFCKHCICKHTEKKDFKTALVSQKIIHSALLMLIL